MALDSRWYSLNMVTKSSIRYHLAHCPRFSVGARSDTSEESARHRVSECTWSPEHGPLRRMLPAIDRIVLGKREAAGLCFAPPLSFMPDCVCKPHLETFDGALCVNTPVLTQ